MKRHSQSRAGSFLEATLNVTVGLVVAVVAQAAVFPRFGVHLPAHDHLSIALAFTLVSLVRSYLLRRLFATWGRG
jgi:hypothetical protein